MAHISQLIEVTSKRCTAQVSPTRRQSDAVGWKPLEFRSSVNFSLILAIHENPITLLEHSTPRIYRCSATACPLASRSTCRRAPRSLRVRRALPLTDTGGTQRGACWGEMCRTGCLRTLNPSPFPARPRQMLAKTDVRPGGAPDGTGLRQMSGNEVRLTAPRGCSSSGGSEGHTAGSRR